MPFNGSGVYTPPAADFPVVTNTVISSTHFNNTINDLATGLSTCLTKDGQTTPTANIKLGGFKLTGVGTPNATNDALTFGTAGTMTTLTASTSVITPLLDTGAAVDLVVKRNSTTVLTIGTALATVTGTLSASTSVIAPIVDSGASSALALKTNNGTTQVLIAHVASAVNFLSLQGGTAGNGINILSSATSSDSNVGIDFGTKGTGVYNFYTRSDVASKKQFAILDAAGADRNITVTGSNGGNPTISTTAGSLAITPSVVLTGGVSGAVAATGGITTSSSTSAIGYTSGAGGGVTQLTSKATAVTLNTLCGTITMNGAALGPNTTVSFFVNNTSIGSTSIVHAIHRAIGTQGAYIVQVSDIQAGVGFRISVLNSTAGSLSEAISLTFIVFICTTA